MITFKPQANSVMGFESHDRSYSGNSSYADICSYLRSHAKTSFERGDRTRIRGFIVRTICGGEYG